MGSDEQYVPPGYPREEYLAKVKRFLDENPEFQQVTVEGAQALRKTFSVSLGELEDMGLEIAPDGRIQEKWKPNRAQKRTAEKAQRRDQKAQASLERRGRRK